jgi:mono/diheme cytochrome c family protein
MVLRSLLMLALAHLVVAGFALSASPPVKEKPVSPQHAREMTASRELFTRSVRKTLSDNCLKCHGLDKMRAGLDLATRESLLKGGENGPVVVPGKGKSSKLYRLTAHLDEPHMPPKTAGKKLTQAQLDDLVRWIDLGAAYDRPLVERPGAGKPKTLVVTAEDRRFWSFRPLARPAIPPVKNVGWVRNPIDRFVLARLEEKGLSPTPEAHRRTLLRRLQFDLTGLPASVVEVEAFLNDSAADAYEKAVDRLLASPAHGERWARHWLDIVRFAESHGFEHDYDRPHAYPYRDFIIQALNLDLGYDDFVKWQLAGDEIEPTNPLALMATGFLGAGVHSTQITANTVEKERYDELDDIVRTMGTAMLGLTVGCARCHDHKYDPIPTRDYYRLVSTFTKTVRSVQDIAIDPEQARMARIEHEAEIKRRESAIERYDNPGVNRERDPAWWQLKVNLRTFKKKGPAIRKLQAMICSEGLPPLRLHSQGSDFLEHTHLLNRGDPNQKVGIVTPSFPQVLMRASEGEKRWQVSPPAGTRTPYLRRSLTNWIADVEYGAGHLLARVIVNRLWQHHFGKGLVSTPSDFGLQGERPSHPELLDWLASELIANGWRLKPIHRLILTSAAYRQGTTVDRHKAAVDPDNRLVWRRAPKRLEAEAIRDTLLAVSGQLDRRMFGPGTLDLQQRRRSIYFFVKRSQLVPMMVLFDAPDGTVGIEQRTNTTIAPQALLMLNNPLVRGAAEALAAQLAARDPVEIVNRGYALTLGRPPRTAELAESVAFLKEQESAYRDEGKKDAAYLARVDFAQVLLGVNEFIYID